METVDVMRFRIKMTEDIHHCPDLDLRLQYEYRMGVLTYKRRKETTRKTKTQVERKY
jgi:hypothetical protein